MSYMRKISVLLLFCCLLTGCRGEKNRADWEQTEESVTGQEGSGAEETVNGQGGGGTEETVNGQGGSGAEEEPDIGSVAAENKKYGLALPKAEAFRDILQDFIYWEHATDIETKDSSSMFYTLKQENCLEREVKIHLYYRECEWEEMDYTESNCYDIVVIFPEEKKLSYFSLTYNARGLSSQYDYGYDAWFSDGIEDELPAWKLEKNKWFGRHYTFLGEAGLTLKRTEARAYTVEDRFPAGEKKVILQAIRREIKKEYKESDLVVYVRDFLPGDEALSGRIVYCNIKKKYEIPLLWIYSSVLYSGPRMGRFEGIWWQTRNSTGYYSPEGSLSVKTLRECARMERRAVDVEKCILAYRIKDGRLVDLKK